MKQQLIGLNYKNKKIKLKVSRVPFWYEGIGLMFKRKTYSKILLFEFKNPVKMSIHSLFVFFPFVAIFLDEGLNVVEIKKVKPFKINISPRVKYKYLVEIPVNEKFFKLISSFDEVSTATKTFK